MVDRKVVSAEVAENHYSQTQPYAKAESRPEIYHLPGPNVIIALRQACASVRSVWPGSCCEVRGRSLYWDGGPGLERKGRHAHQPTHYYGFATTARSCWRAGILHRRNAGVRRPDEWVRHPSFRGTGGTARGQPDH